MKIYHLNYSDVSGGAARASYRIHKSLRTAGVDSRMMVSQSYSGDYTVISPKSTYEKMMVIPRHWLGAQLRRLSGSKNTTIHSPALLRSRWPKRINNSEIDIVNLHWIAGEMLSVADIARIRKPIVWTLHDMWAFCGSEHLSQDNRWRDGYNKNNRPSHESGFDLNKWTWKRKRKYWKESINIVTPSNWLANYVRGSALMHDWPVTVIPNAIDTTRWQPVGKSVARELLGYSPDVPIILFGAIGGGNDPNKGCDLLKAALAKLFKNQTKFEMIIYGQNSPENPFNIGFPVHYLGHLHDDISLQLVYNIADVLAIPSKLENLPNTGLEALACGTPVVAFDTGGLPDIVVHKKTGYLAKAFDVTDFANGIKWVLTEGHKANLQNNAREYALKHFSYPVVAKKYIELYESILK